MANIEPLNICIYCGSANQLSDEHVVPFSLMAKGEPDFILRKASCEECRKITSRFETQAVNHLGDVREYLDLKTRSTGKRKKRTGFVDAKTKDDKQDIKISIKQSFPFLMIPYFPFYPRLITGDEKKDFHEKSDLWGKPLGTGNVPQGSVGFSRKKNYKHTTAYYRMCAKIAHAFCIHSDGLNSFKPLLLEFILSDEGDPSLFIGGENDGFLKDESIILEGKESLHAIDRFEVSCSAGNYVGARVKLFSNKGAPSIFVIVGEINQEKKAA